MGMTEPTARDLRAADNPRTPFLSRVPPGWHLLLSPRVHRLSQRFSAGERAAWAIGWAVVRGCAVLGLISGTAFEVRCLRGAYVGLTWPIVGALSFAAFYLVPWIVFTACEHHPRFAHFIYRAFQEVDPRGP